MVFERTAQPRSADGALRFG